MYYKIGKFANMLGVTTDTIRLYEKLGIIKAVKDENTNYRYFSDFDSKDLLWSRWYRSIGIPLPKVIKLMSNSKCSNILDEINGMENKIEKEIEEKNRLLEKLKAMCQEYSEMNAHIGNCSIENIPAIYRLKATITETLLPDNTISELMNHWLNKFPYTFISIFVPENELLWNGKNTDYYNWGISVTVEEAKSLNLNIDNEVEYYAEKKCVSSVITQKSSTPFKIDSVAFMLDFIRQNNFNIDGDCIGKIIMREKVNDDIIYYMSVHIPIK